MEVHSWPQLMDALLTRKVAFLTAFFAVFFGTYTLLAWFDFLPELVLAPEESAPTESTVISEVMVPVEEPAPEELLPVLPVYPLTLRIPALDTDISILNPTSRTVSDLDAALLEGVVRHPDSATLEQSGTVFILGHSSYLPVVRNKNFQALNGIQNLKWGDEVVVESVEGKYVYRVEKVYRARAQDVVVPIAGATKKLFLATCNSFGSIDDRYIVEADFQEIRSY